MSAYTTTTQKSTIYGGIELTTYYDCFDNGRRYVSRKCFEKNGRRAVLDIYPGYVTWGRDNARLTRINEDGTVRSNSAFKDRENAERKAIEWVLGK